MNLRSLAARRWRALSITTKFSVAFGLLLGMILLVALSSYLALTAVRRETEAAIVTSTEIQKLVLEMDQGLANARRLQSDFFLQYSSLGFEEAESRYVKPAITQITQVITHSTTLKALIAQSDVSAALRAHDADLNLYLSSAERNARIFLEAVEMTAALSAPETGLLDQLAVQSAQLSTLLAESQSTDLLLIYYEMQAFEQEYLITRRRPVSQSALNVGAHLRQAIEESPALDASQKTAAQEHLRQYLALTEQIADLDVTMRGKFNDFDLQAASLEPISAKLLVLADAEVTRARQQIRQTSRLAVGVMSGISVLGIGAALVIGKLLNNSITRNVIALTRTAANLQRGDLGAAAHIRSEDELGLLATTFNAMSAEIRAKVTELTALNQALQTSEKKYRKLFEDSYDCIVLARMDGEILDINPAGERLLGSARETLIGRNARTLYVNPQDRERLLNGIEEKGINSIETQLRRLDGVQIHTLLSTTAQRAEDGRITGLLTIIHDITERIRAEQSQQTAAEERARLLTEIREQARRVQQIVDTVPEGVLLLDRECRIGLANPTARQYLQLLSADADTPLTHLGDRPIQELLTSPPKGLWHEVTVASATQQVFQVLARSVENGPQPGGWVLVIHDETQQRQIERQIQQQERLAAVGQLAAGIAHDFNNIMAAIVLYAQMMARSPTLSPRDQERMQTINEQALHASNLIQQILDFSRRAVLERRPLDLAPLLKEQVKLLTRTLPENIQVELHMGNADYTIQGDPTRLQQIFMNLAVNARDAMPDGGWLGFSLERVHFSLIKDIPLPGMTPGDWIVLTIADTGVGIPAHVLPHIFEPFFTTKAPGKGSGLGLAQVHGIVGAHEGFIDVQTQTTPLAQTSEAPAPITGTRFVLYLPAYSHNQPTPQLQETAVLPHGQGETLLLVEDNAATRAALVESLQLLNYRVLTAEDGQKALAILAHPQNDIALIVSDVVMPNMGGIALFHILHERAIPIKIILLSGHPLTDELEALQAQDAASDTPLLAGWLLKPPTLERLAGIVARGLAG